MELTQVSTNTKINTKWVMKKSEYVYKNNHNDDNDRSQFTNNERTFLGQFTKRLIITIIIGFMWKGFLCD